VEYFQQAVEERDIIMETKPRISDLHGSHDLWVFFFITNDI
jgi:hypothetical protein